MTVAMLAVLIGLGTWQLRRLQWKRGVLAQLDAAEHAPPAPLGDSPAPYSIVAATGHLRPDLAALYGAEVHTRKTGEAPGVQLLMPLERAAGPPVLVDLGWVADHAPLPPLPTGDSVTITGYVRPPEHVGWFAATDDAGLHRFYTLDPAVIGMHLGLPTMAPFTVIALGPPPAAPDAPIPAEHLPRPPNNHLQYVITWYGLAAALLVIFAVYVRGVLRE
jgi:surfeit locus 1 family protein